MKLSIPLISQPKKSVECGAACVAMINQFYHIPISFAQLKKDLEIFNEGTYAPQLGLHLLKQRFKVSIVTNHPQLFRAGNKFKNSSELLAHFNSLKKVIKGKTNKRALRFFIDFIEAGGNIIPQIPSASIIKKEILDKRPLIALLTSSFLFNSKLPPKFNFHFNVITGIDNNYIYVNDPEPNKSYGGKRKHKINDYLYGIHASTYGCIDNGSLLLINKK